VLSEMCMDCKYLDADEKYCLYYAGYLQNIDAYYYEDCDKKESEKK